MLKKIVNDINKEDESLFSKNIKTRMLDIESILRFFGMLLLYNQNDNFKLYKDLTSELN